MANMTFKANLLPNSDLGYSLGSSEQKWKINGSSLGTAAFKNESGTWAISISGSAGSVAWSNVTGKPSTFAPSSHNHDSSYSANHLSSYSFTTTQPLSKYITFDQSSPSGAPKSSWFNGFISSHSNYLASYIINEHRTMNWYVGYGEYSNNSAIAPTWYTLIHSGNYTSYTVTKTGSGASGTWGINITGSAGSVAWGNVTGKPGSFTPASHNHDSSYVKKSGDTMTGTLSLNSTTPFLFYGSGSGTYNRSCLYCDSRGLTFETPRSSDSGSATILDFRVCTRGGQYAPLRASAVYGAVWNDYAEMRNIPEVQQLMEPKRPLKDYETPKRNIPMAGYCVREVGDDTMVLSTTRLQKGCKIISDTFGFNIGETEDAKTPVAVCGRVLAYPYEDREEYRNHIGDFVCSGPDGTISIMTDEEALTQPWSIIGTISAVPDYERWGEDNVLVDGRVWIYVR